MFDDKTVIEFLRRSYLAADGLWFLKVEDTYSYDEALRLDEQVWEVLPKIQARKARELLGITGGTLADLAHGLWLKFASEGYQHRVLERTPDLLRIEITACPWLAVLQKAGRILRAREICNRICTRDFTGWAAQFAEGIRFTLESKMPDGDPACTLGFVCSSHISDFPEYEDSQEAAG